ncbi:hypothetical protein N7493_007852 [Penicillium malachiteum]|uniref:Uncharacterized protein n=1 Tax=Penicillium malachiteum TaxID=1324776 RepID=A0AAD6MUC9_9EURO|nr:hypothetical protein N7493_007852 [Penicillium malachiteum]
MGLPSRESLHPAMREPEDHWRNGPFRCVPTSTYLSSFENISPYNDPSPSSFFQAPMPPTVTPIPPHYTPTYGYLSNNPPSGFKDTYNGPRRNFHESLNSEPQTADKSFSQTHEKDLERNQSPINEQTKYKDLHRGRECKKMYETLPLCRVYGVPF